MKTIFFILPILILFSSFFTVNVADALIVAYSLEDLAETSEFVLIGEITEVTPLVPGYLLVFSDGYDRFQFDVTLSVEHDMDEKYDQNTIQFRIHDSREEFGLGIEDEQKFEVGERVLVFIGEKDPESVMGDAYLVQGLTQGKYLLENGMAFGTHYPEGIDENELILKIQNIRHAKPIPEPEQEITEYERCGPGTTFQNGICVVTELEENTVKSESNRWGATSSNYNIKSPLKQFREGISSYEIECRNGLVLILKIDGSPACIKSESHKKLYERGWTKLVPIQPEIGKTGTLDFQVNNENFKIKYDIRGGALDKIFYDEPANSVIFQLNQPYNGELTVELPRTLMEIIQKDYDADYFVLLDGVETDFGFEDTSFGKKISIKIPQRTYEMELIGSF